MENKNLQALYEQLIQLIDFFNQPSNDQALLEAADVALDYKLFPLFILISRTAPTTVGALAKRTGRSHSTLSRQVDRLEKSGVTLTQAAANDSRVREIVLTEKGQALIQKISVARLNKMGTMLAKISAKDQADLLRILQEVTPLLGNHE
jgi:DNA-binding MarR family transcriptional regulator